MKLLLKHTVVLKTQRAFLPQRQPLPGSGCRAATSRDHTDCAQFRPLRSPSDCFDNTSLTLAARGTVGGLLERLPRFLPAGVLCPPPAPLASPGRSEEHTSELQSLMPTPYSVFS